MTQIVSSDNRIICHQFTSYILPNALVAEFEICIEDYCINNSVKHYQLLCFYRNKSCVLIRDVRGVNALLLLMLVTTHHTKHMLNYEYLTSARIMHIFSSPEPLGSQGELIVYPSRRRRPSSLHHFQRSSFLKPLGQSKPNFMWSLLGKGERKFV